MPKPKSPLEKPSSGHSRRPSGPRRTSSGEKKTSHSGSSSKHGAKESVGHASGGRASATMSGFSTSGNVPLGEVAQAEAQPVMETKGFVDEAQSQMKLKGGDVSTETAAAATYGDSGVQSDVKENISGGVAATSSNTTDEVERLRAAVNSQLRFNQQRERLSRSMKSQGPSGTGGRSRVSPINEESSVSPPSEDIISSPTTFGPETTSTESARTVRGETPAAYTMNTPSYPFPPMKPPRQLSWGGHKPFTTLSPTVVPQNFAATAFDAPRDRLTSGSVTPASTANFQPPGSVQSKDDPNFPSPNLYELSLLLTAEPGLDPWWHTVVQIMRDVFKAERVTLAVPADSTDIENVPWGQKATYNPAEEDELSLTYLPRGSSYVPSSVGTNETSVSGVDSLDNSPPTFSGFPENVRPGLISRHSFTAYEDSKKSSPARPENRAVAAARAPLPRSKSYLSVRPEQAPRSGTLHNADLNLRSLEEHLAIEEGKDASAWEPSDPSAATKDGRGRVFPVLQALDYEVDPLIDSAGVIRVLERGKVIALTRDYPYLEKQNQENEGSGGSKSSQKSAKNKDKDVAGEKGSKKVKPELTSRASSFLSGPKGSRRSSRARSQTRENSKPQDDISPPTINKYEEYEQHPPSPWSQSPAPSPAVRADPNENPFFTNAQIDEDSFNPGTTPQDYSNVQQVEAIGNERSWTVLHIPLAHVLLSKPVHSFHLDTTAMESRSRSKTQEQKHDTPKAQTKGSGNDKQTPIAILSILSPIIPYPSSFRHSLEHLAPHLATSFSLCRYHTNLETEIAGLTRKRPHTTGFGAIAPTGQIREHLNLAQLSYSPEEAPQHSLGGSITSPSDYSGISRSAAGSPAPTPGWEHNSLGAALDKRPTTAGSPGFVGGDGYFNVKTRPPLSRVDTAPTSVGASRRISKERESPVAELKKALQTDDKQGGSTEQHDKPESVEKGRARAVSSTSGDSQTMAPPPLKQVKIEPPHKDDDRPEARDTSPSRVPTEMPLSPWKLAMRGAAQSIVRHPPHTQLHSYGADFAATFQSLPSTTQAGKPATGQNVPARGAAVTIDMPPPSDRLKTLMIDTLPAHLFVALPQTGEVVWVNNRYLTYRGQTVADLYNDPWSSIHPDEREDYLKAWTHAIRTGEQFSTQVRIRRFDGQYRWFYTRAIGGRDTRGVIVQWYGSFMDIHDQREAEVKAARQEEIEASEAKHRLLANLIPQIIFSATEDEGVTFANQQWLSYTGQAFDDALGLGFMDFVHPDDLAKCRIPTDRPPTPTTKQPKDKEKQEFRSMTSQSPAGGKSSNTSDVSETTVRGVHHALSRQNSSSSDSVYELPTADLHELARSGVIKVTTDSDGRLSYTTEVRLKSKSGEYRWHLVRCVEVDNINFGGGDGSWFGACTDINDHKILEAKLKEAMESKGKFLSNMSHEIRTPLIGISGMVSFLQDTALNEEQMDYTNTIQTSANSLLLIINDILDLSKVDAGMMKLSYDWFHTRSLIEDVNELVSTMAIAKRLELNYVVEEDVPAMVKGDKVRIRQVLLNVIGNAIKFTTEGEVFSRCRVYHDPSANFAGDEIMLEFSVIDTGRGFTKEEAELIFKPFSQIDGSSTRQHGGSGLGLVISRQLAELHGGHMHGTAVPGKGSTFTFTAKFGLPTDQDRPDAPLTPALKGPRSARSSESAEVSAHALKSAGGAAMLAHRIITSPPTLSPQAYDSSTISSSASSDPSIRSARTHTTERSSSSSINVGLAGFKEAARTSSQELNLQLPDTSSEGSTPTNVQRTLSPKSKESSGSSGDFKQFRPPMYSILLICRQTHSLEATTKHIEMTLPKDVPHQITPLASVGEAQKMIGGDDPVIFTHIVINLGSAEEIIALMDQIFASVALPHTSIVILSDPVQRQAVMKLASEYDYEQLAKDNRVIFIYKPVKPSRFAVIFDPDKERDLSTDRNRFSAQQQVADQKQNYLDVEKRLGNKGLKVLLVEDNLVNQKVLLKFLGKVGIAVETALDGVECTDKVFAQSPGHYSLILCDLHMPRKDGYQTCREIRLWEKKNNHPKLPMIALSANVMADVVDKCVAAGFDSYVTKPVDFKELSAAMSNLLDPQNSTKST